ncbi:MAG: carboxypeptidase-like regulatory domain-containing protein [Saprospiraceae bacterium]|nr:carboxypeptidase-like regulatory domain-containing protein [Saprospiraceae bacterium]
MKTSFSLLPVAMTLALLPTLLPAQEAWVVEGRILDSASNKPLAYATVYNESTQKGAISNLDGYFRIGAISEQDVIVVSFIGYEKERIPLRKGRTYYEVLLRENAISLDEVGVVASRETDWYELLRACRKNQPQTALDAKAYYELKSFHSDEQIELVEGFYNARIEGYAVKKLDLKAGRLAIRPHEGTIFVSMESSRAITMLPLFEDSGLFPASPLELNRRELRKHYSISMSKKYKNENADSVYVLEYVPNENSGLFFSGEIWINHTKKHILKITRHCQGTARHPFKPIFPSDTIRGIDLSVTSTFAEENGKVFFNHIDFIYTVDYKDRNGAELSILTHAVLYAYEPHQTFSQPNFEFNSEQIGDYRRINAFPYNDFFWDQHDEPKVSDQQDRNRLFFNDAISLTNRTIFNGLPGNITHRQLPNNQAAFMDDPRDGQRLLQHPYMAWSKNRILLREFRPESTEPLPVHYGARTVVAEQYNLSVKIFLDVNTYADSTHMLTAAIFDPYETFFRLPMDNAAFCFINTWFDLMEIERRKLEAAIAASDRTAGAIYEIYRNHSTQWEQLRQQYFKEVQRGRNRAALEKWNRAVRAELGIDNMEIFLPEQVSE